MPRSASFGSGLTGTAPPLSVPQWPEPRWTLAAAAVVTVVVTVASHLAPDQYANTIVGGLFLAATWWLVLRRDVAAVRAHGMALGGLTEPVALDVRRIFRESLAASGWCLLLMLIIFPPFWYGYSVWWNVDSFDFVLPDDMANRAMGQLLVIALPEELFFRGYLQSALDGAWAKRRFRLLGAQVGLGWLLGAAIFAVGHLLTVPNPARLAVFAPALLFGWLRARTGGVGAGILFHACCNIFSTLLAHGYGLSG